MEKIKIRHETDFVGRDIVRVKNCSTGERGIIVFSTFTSAFYIFAIVTAILALPFYFLSLNPVLMFKIKKYCKFVIPLIAAIIGIGAAKENGKFTSKAIPCFLVSMATIIFASLSLQSDAEYTSTRGVLTICLPVLICSVILGILSRKTETAGSFELLMIFANGFSCIIYTLLYCVEGDAGNFIAIIFSCLFLGTGMSLIYIALMLAACLPYLMVSR